MIRYTLKCRNGHDFESWFKSASAYDALFGAGQVSCPHCGDTKVEKALMAPPVSTSRSSSTVDDTVTSKAETTQNDAGTNALSAPRDEIETAIAAMKAHVEENSEYVGLKFSQQARAMHDGEIPPRPIYGEAKLDEAKSLIEEGVPVLPLPFTPKRKTN